MTRAISRRRSLLFNDPDYLTGSLLVAIGCAEEDADMR
jgi:hypothetical protein